MLRLILGLSGTGKTELIMSEVIASARAGMPTVLIVPEQGSFEYERGLIHRAGGVDVSGAEVYSFSRLSQPIGLITGGFAGTRADEGVQLIYMAEALRKCSPSLTAYRRAATHGSFAQRVLMSINELRMAGVDSAMLMDAAQSVGGALGNRLNDLALILAEYEGAIGEKFIDPQTDLERLYDMIVDSRYFVGKRVFIDSFKSFTGGQMRVISEILAQADEVSVALCCDSLHSRGSGDIFDNVKRTAAKLTAAARSAGCSVAAPTVLGQYRRFAGAISAAADSICGISGNCFTGEGRVTVCQALTCSDEADYVARTIARLVRTEGYRYRDFAVIYRNGGVYSGLLADALGRYGIACHTDSRTGSHDLLLMRYVLILLEAAVNYNQDKILALSKLPLSPLSEQQAWQLDNYALIWSPRGNSWCSDFADNPDGFGKPMNESALAEINRSRAKLMEPIIRLHSLLEGGSVREICTAIYNLLADDGSQRLTQYADRLDADGRHAEAGVQRASWDCLMKVLDNCVYVYGDTMLPARELIDVIRTIISAEDLGAIPSRADEVIVGSADRIRLGKVKVAFVVGLNYGQFPALPEGKGLFSARDRRRLIKQGFQIDDGSVEVSVDERFVAYMAVTCACEQLFATYRVSNSSGEVMMPSDIINRIREAEGTVFVREDDSRADRLEGAAPAAQWLLERYNVDSVRAAITQCPSSEIELGCERVERLRSFAQNRLTQSTASALFGLNLKMSPSKVESYSSCAFSFFCRYGIGASKLQPADINVLERGTVIHYLLERAVIEYGGELYKLGDSQLEAFVQTVLDEYVSEHFGGLERRSPRFVNTVSVIAQTSQQLIRYVGEQFRLGCFEPHGCEINVGRDIAPIELPLEQGKLTMIGKIDRADIYRADGKTYLRVVDYKTGSNHFDLSDVLYGLNMQMLLYLTAMCRDGGMEPAGVLYMPCKGLKVSGERNQSDAGFGNLKMNGMLLADLKMLKDMDGGSGFYPVSFTQKGNLHARSSVMTAEQFRQVGDFIAAKLAEIGNSVQSGRFDILPTDSNGRIVCERCDYRSVCLHDISVQNRTTPSLSRDEAVELMREVCQGGH